MKIEESRVDDRTVLTLKGKMLIGEGDEQLREKVNSLVEDGQIHITLNLAEVPYVDSAGLGEIVRSYTAVTRAEGTLKVKNLSKRVKELIEVTRLDTVLGVEA